jgi:predicted pyridoxine 5'-phosphate oxidase superfamily flavin-nucleotide-binding protein
MIIHNPGNHLLRIDALWAFISVDKDGHEGVIAAPLGNMGTVPLVAADEARLQSLMPIARQICDALGTTVRLIKLTTREEIAVLNPRQGGTA